MLYARIALLTWDIDIVESASILNPVLTRLGLVVPGTSSSSSGVALSFECLSESVTVAESSGFDSIWVSDQPPAVGGLDEPVYQVWEAYTLLGALAQRTSSVRLGALVTGVTSRAPALLGKQITALDVLSDGRAVLGVGAGRVDPHDIDPAVASVGQDERFERLEEALKVFRAMFTQEPVRFEGRFYRTEDGANRPHPVQQGGPPVLIGGNGEHLTLRLVAEYADACNIWGDDASVRRKIGVLENHCAVIGRDPSSITKTVLATLVIAPTNSQARERLEELQVQQDPRVISTQTAVISGGPDSVTQQVVNLLGTGIDGVIVKMPDAHDVASVALAGTALSRSI